MSVFEPKVLPIHVRLIATEIKVMSSYQNLDRKLQIFFSRQHE